MENVLFIARESEEIIEDTLDSQAFPDTSPKQYFVFVPPADGSKIVSWVMTDPDSEESMTFNKDFRLAFEFKDVEHARRAKYLACTMLNVDTVRIFGDIE